MSRVTEFRYTSDLFLVRRVNGNKKLFEVLRPYTVEFKLDGKYHQYTVRKGFLTDLASIPALVPKWIAQKVAAHLEAAVVHDQLCVDKTPWDSAVAADIFEAGMKAAKVNGFMIWYMAGLVRVAGPRWEV